MTPKKKILFVETEYTEATTLANTFQFKKITENYELKFISPNFNLKHPQLVEKLVESTCREIRKYKNDIKLVLVDIRIIEKEQDTTGVVIAEKIKEAFPDLPVVNMTNYSEGPDLYIFAKSSLAITDGVLPKSLFSDSTFAKDDFEKILVSLQKKTARLFHTNNTTFLPDVKETKIQKRLANICVITALRNPEYQAFNFYFKKLVPVPGDLLTYPDTSPYYSCELTNREKRVLKIVVATDDFMGMPATCSLATRMIQQFNPEYIVLLGICAGIEGKTNIGDIIVASQCWDYGSGKFETDEKTKGFLFNPTPKPENLSSEVRKKLVHFNDEKLKAEIKKANRAVFENNHELEVYTAPFASGSAVVANSDVVKVINKQHIKLRGFDMEAYGMFYAAAQASVNSLVKPICIKGVSDFGTEKKGTEMKQQHQIYAARNSVLYFKKLFEKCL